MFNNVRKHAFTLAEVLVTLGIIGIVSAMTIPSLTQSWQKQAYVTQLKKVYSQLSQAAELAIQNEKVIDLDESKYSGSEPAGKEFLKDYFKIVKECNEDTISECFASSYRTLDGGQIRIRPDQIVVTADGVAMGIYNNDWNFSEVLSDDHGYLSLYVDINGQKGPNVVGRDFFYLEVYSDGKVSESYEPVPDSEKGCQCRDGGCGYGVGCFSNILTSGWSMDY